MSQRLSAGFNWPRFSVGAGDPDCTSPRFVRRGFVGSPWSRRYGTFFASPATGLCHPLNSTCLPSRAFTGLRARSQAPSLWSRVVGVAHPANCAASLIVRLFFVPLARTRDMGSLLVLPPLPLAASGVGHPPQPLSDVRRADARSAEINRRAGVARTFQVSEYKVEPPESGCNLFAKDHARPALRDEPVPGGP